MSTAVELPRRPRVVHIDRCVEPSSDRCNLAFGCSVTIGGQRKRAAACHGLRVFLDEPKVTGTGDTERTQATPPPFGDGAPWATELPPSINTPPSPARRPRRSARPGTFASSAEAWPGSARHGRPRYRTFGPCRDQFRRRPAWSRRLDRDGTGG